MPPRGAGERFEGRRGACGAAGWAWGGRGDGGDGAVEVGKASESNAATLRARGYGRAMAHGGLGAVALTAWAGLGGLLAFGRFRAGCGCADDGAMGREDAGPPEQQELLQAVEQASEGGDDEGVQGRRQQGAVLQGPLSGGEEGDRGAEGGS